MWLRRRSRRIRLLFGAALLSSPCWLGCGGFVIWQQLLHWFVLTPEDRAYRRTESALYPDGLPSVGRKLKAEMEGIPDPETALRLHPEWVAVRFNTGEWVFGHGIDSHWFDLGRGTLVVKDSRGRVRIFFGHVCGPNAGIEFFAKDLPTLDAFYNKLAEVHMLREWRPDD